MSTDELRYWLALWHIPGVGPVKFANLLEHFPSLSQLFAEPTSALLKLGWSENLVAAITNPNWVQVEQDLVWLQGNNRQIITWQDASYSALLRQINDAPPVLFIKGNVEILNNPQMAIVGSRNPTLIGEKLASDFAQALVNAGFVITSGLAIGIDSAAHTGALSAKGRTIAVLGSGINHIYPRTNQKLAEEILANQGAVISEFPLDMLALASNFPQRNRIVSGLALGTLVVEATIRSGSLITASLAAEQGREVFAIPGSTHNPQARGCHYLIRQGAKLVETASDILEELPELTASNKKHSHIHMTTSAENLLDEDQRKLLECVGYEVTTIDDLLMRSRFPAGKVAAILLMLELNNYITTVPGGYIRVI